MSKKERVCELIRYAIVGGITTGINLLVFGWLKEIINYVIANTIGYLIAVVINYLLNAYVVFEISDSGIKYRIIQFVQFVMTRIGALLFDNVCFMVLVSILHLPIWPSRIFLSIFIIAGTYIINKIIIFK